MRTSRFFIATLKEVPAEAEIASHRLMLRAGLIRRLSAGIYTWLPLGVRVLHKVEAVVRQEMNRAGAIELSMPVVQRSEEHTSELQSLTNLVCRLLLEKKKKNNRNTTQ